MGYVSLTKMAFHGIGIGEFEVNNVAFDIADIFALFGVKIGSFPVYWYGIIITFGIILAFLYVNFRGKYERVKGDDIIDVAIVSVVCGIIGARLYFVLMELDSFIPESGNFFEFLKNVFDLRSGGLAIYGGVIGGVLAVIIVTLIKKINCLKFLDMAAPGLMLAQILGRWGNFFNGEAYGGLVESDHPLYFMRMSLQSYNTQHDEVLKEALGAYPAGMVDVHPTFLYESLWNLTGFILINVLYKKKKFNGQIICMYLAWYGFGRFFVEALRTDSLYIPGTSLRVSQIVGIACFAIFGALIVAGLIYSKKKLYAEGKTLNAFDNFIKPRIEEHPVFFEKKEKKAKKIKIGAENDENAELGAEKADEESENNVEDSENGTDN